MDEWADFPRMIAARLGLKPYRVDRGDGVAVPLLVRRGDPYFYASKEAKRDLNDNPPPLNAPATQWRLRIAFRNLAEAALENAAASDDWDRWFEGLISMMNDSEGIAAHMAALPSLPFTPDLPNDLGVIRPLKEEYDSAMTARTEERKWEGMPFSALRAFSLTSSAMGFENNRDDIDPKPPLGGVARRWATAPMTHSPYTIAVPDAEIAALRERLRCARWLPEVPGSAWLYGVDLAFLRELCEHWVERFDWRAVERRLNAFPQFRAPLDCANGETLQVHFIHRRSPRADAVPLLIQHGWPSSVYEFHKIIDALAEPDDPTAPAFHVVAPSLPGYGWSDIPRRAGFGPAAIADLWARLMRELGYERFAYHGGDWGAAVGGQLGLRHPERLRALHLTAAALAPPGASARAQSEQETRFFRDEQEPYVREDAAHRAIHGTRFQTLSYGLADSPVGLAAWIVDKWWMLSDCMRPEEAPRGGDVLRRFTMDELLATVSIYWFTETINSSMRIYHEAGRPAAEVEAELGGRVRLREGERVAVPTGFARLVRGTPLPPRSWCERAFNVAHWTNFPEGGHFPAMEIPNRLLADLRAFLPHHS